MDINEIEIYDFGIRLRNLRKAIGMTQEEVAARIGVTKETLYRYENNLQVPSSNKIRKLAVVLNTSSDYILGLDDVPTINIYGFTPEQRKVLYDFIKYFINKD